MFRWMDLALGVSLFGGVAFAQPVRIQPAENLALDRLVQVSNAICMTPADYGFSVQGQVQANFQASLPTLLAKFVSEKLSATALGAAEFHKGIAQKDVGTAISNRNACAANVFLHLLDHFAINDTATGARITRPKRPITTYRVRNAAIQTSAAQTNSTPVVTFNGGSNGGVIAGTINGSITIGGATNNGRDGGNEGVLTPGDMPTPPIAASARKPPPDALKVFLGSSVAWATKMPHTVLMMGDDQMITIDRKDNGQELVVTVLRVFDDRNDIIARIDADGFWVQNSTRNKRPDPHTLVVFDHTDTEVLRIVFLNPEAMSVTGIFRHAGLRPLIVNSDEIVQGDNRMVRGILGENSVADLTVR